MNNLTDYQKSILKWALWALVIAALAFTGVRYPQPGDIPEFPEDFIYEEGVTPVELGTTHFSGLAITDDASVGGNLTVVGTTSSTGAQTFSGAVTLNNTLTVDGVADAVQTTVQGNATQTSDIFVVEGSDTYDLFSVSGSGDVLISGTTPLLTIGDADGEDAGILIDGNAQDYYFALDDTADDLLIGLGSAIGTTGIVYLDENQDTGLGGASAGSKLDVTGNVLVDGAADEVQLTVQSNGTQTTDAFVVEDSSAYDLFSVSGAGDILISGTTPLVTLGDADEEDAGILYDGNAQDYYLALDDTADDFILGLGNAIGTTGIVYLDENQDTGLGGASAGAKLDVTGNVLVDGAADEEQLVVQCNATQTTNAFVVEDSSTYDLFRITGAGDVLISGTTPLVTIGDADEEDTTILFDGNAQDYYMALDDTADDLLIGLGNAVGTTGIIYLDENQDFGLGGASAGAKLDVTGNAFVDGAADEVQLTVQGNGTQTSNAFVVEQSDGVDVFSVSNAGNTTISGTISLQNGETIVNSTDTVIQFGGFIALTEGSVLDLGAGFTITPTASYQPITNSTGGSVTSDASTAIADGAVAGALLIICNEDAQDMVIKDGANTAIGGDLTLTGGADDCLTLIWDGADWVGLAVHDN